MKAIDAACLVLDRCIMIAKHPADIIWKPYVRYTQETYQAMLHSPE